MAVRFDAERMQRALDVHERWWSGTLDRPLVSVTVPDAYPQEKRTPAPILSQASCADFSWSPEQVIDAIDENLSRAEYLGDSFPFVNFSAFGPGVLAALCGAKLDNSSGRVWFSAEDMEITDIHVRYDPENCWAKRIKALYKAGLERWNGSVIMGMPDLGGVLDVAATFRGSENLLMDLYDNPDEVLRLAGEIQTAWHAAYSDFSEVIRPQGVHTDWSGLLSREPSYILQCDFCYMIGNDMFRRFVLDTLREDTRRLTHTIYHLDGIGELPHLDDVLALEKLDAVQWVYGDGQPGAPHWIDVYKRIAAAGKRMWIVGNAQEYMEVLSQVHGTPYATLSIPAGERELAEKLLSAR